MSSLKDKLKNALKNPLETSVYYFASTESALLAEYVFYVANALQAETGEDVTRVDGPVPNIGDAISAAGAISFFGTPRLVVMMNVSPTTMNEKDVDELVELFGMLENAIVIVGALYKDKKTASNKKAKKLLQAAEKNGIAAELVKPGRRENLAYINEIAQNTGAVFDTGAADALLDSVGDDHVLLQNEVEKLAAICGYGTISRQVVATYSIPNMEADVFELSRYITGRRKTIAFEKLHLLLEQRQEPIAIAAVLAGTYVDMYRVRAAAEQGKSTTVAFEEMGYKGSPYRLQKAKENATKYSMEQLEDAVLCLADLDAALKSSALSDKSILLEAAVGELLHIGERR